VHFSNVEEKPRQVEGRGRRKVKEISYFNITTTNT